MLRDKVDIFFLSLGAAFFLVYVAYVVFYDFFIIVYSSPLFLSIGFLWCLRFSKQAKANLALVISSVFVVSAAFEGVLRYLDALEVEQLTATVKLTAERLGKTPDLRSKLEAVAGMRKEGRDVFPYLGDTEFFWGGKKYAVISTLPQTDTLLCNEVGDYLIYRSDELGFRNPAGTWSRKSNDVLLVGDSFTHGLCVDDKDSIAGSLREKGMSVVNLGVTGAGPITYLAALREYGRYVNPKDTFFIFFEGNDFLRAPEDRGPTASASVIQRYLDPDFSQGLYQRADSLVEGMEEYYEVAFGDQVRQMQELGLSEGLDLRDVLTFGRLRGMLGLNPRYESIFQQISKKREIEVNLDELDERALDYLIDIVELSKEESEKIGSKFHFVYIPGIIRYMRHFDDEQRELAERIGLGEVPVFSAQRYKTEIINAMLERGISVVDVEPSFTSDPSVEDLFLSIRSHYSPRGYRRVAEMITRHLTR